MTPEELQQLKNDVQYLKDRLNKIEFSDRFVFNKDIQFGAGRGIITNESANPEDRFTIGKTTNQKVSFYGADGTGQQSAPTYAGLITISGSGDDANINTNFSRLESWMDDVIGVLRTIGITS